MRFCRLQSWALVWLCQKLHSLLQFQTLGGWFTDRMQGVSAGQASVIPGKCVCPEVVALFTALLQWSVLKRRISLTQSTQDKCFCKLQECLKACWKTRQISPCAAPGGVAPLRKVPRLLNPNCKNEIWGVQPHMLRKEKIISHPTEGFAKIKSRGSRNKINKIPSQHPHVPEIKLKGSRSASVFLSFLSQCWWQRTVCFPCVASMSSLVTGWTFQIFPVGKTRNEFKGFPRLSHEKGNLKMG